MKKPIAAKNKGIQYQPQEFIVIQNVWLFSSQSTHRYESLQKIFL